MRWWNFCRTISDQLRRAGDSKFETGHVEALRFHEKACRLDCIKWFTILVIGLLGLEQNGVPGSQASIRTRFGGVNRPHGARGNPLLSLGKR
jgi:hypothetical protein